MKKSGYIQGVLVVSLLGVLGFGASVLALSGCSSNDQSTMIQDTTLSFVVREWSKKIQEYPKNPEYYFERGKALLEEKRKKLAVADLEKALELAPQVDYHLQLAEAYFKSDETKKAVDAYEEAVKLYPKEAKAHRELGVFQYYCYGVWGDYLYALYNLQLMIYNRLAKYYNTLSYMGTLGQIQVIRNLIHRQWVQGKNVLVVGVGTGGILPYVLVHGPQQVVGLDLSDSMLEQAKRHYRKTPNTSFICTDFFEYKTTNTYDLVIFDFFLDQFNAEELLVIMEKTKTLLSPQGNLLTVDYCEHGNYKHSWVKTRFMQIVTGFFRTLSNYRFRHVPPWESKLAILFTSNTEYQALWGLLKLKYLSPKLKA